MFKVLSTEYSVLCTRNLMISCAWLCLMRILPLGTGPFAVPTFRWLLASEHTVPALVTRPTPPTKGREKVFLLNPMHYVAIERSLEVYAPDSINTEEARQKLAAWQPDLLMVCDYGQILSRELLAVAPLGGINLHGSLLPKYRGVRGFIYI